MNKKAECPKVHFTAEHWCDGKLLQTFEEDIVVNSEGENFILDVVFPVSQGLVFYF